MVYLLRQVWAVFGFGQWSQVDRGGACLSAACDAFMRYASCASESDLAIYIHVLIGHCCTDSC